MPTFKSRRTGEDLRNRFDTSSIFELGLLDEAFQAAFNPHLPWLFETDDEGIVQYESEEAALEAQRSYRIKKGFYPRTGEKICLSKDGI